MNYLIDTNIVSELLRPAPNSGVLAWAANMLIAAIAQAHQLIWVTRNIRDFEGCGIGLLNPFSTEGS